jgi:hypothetical protein
VTTYEVFKLECGVYFLKWKSGMGSVAAVGIDRVGETWYAPSNWITVPSYDWDIVESVELITTQEKELSKRGIC